MKIHRAEAECFHAERERETDGRTGGRADMMKLVVALRNVANAPVKLTAQC
jgi:hypothetical protein